MALLNRKILFVHINKSCGGIITHNFSKNGINEVTGYHRTLEDMLMIVKNEYNLCNKDLFIFTIVRNPWERMLSMYLFYKKIHIGQIFYSGNKIIDNDFNNWIEYIYSKNFDRNRIHSKVNIFKYCFSNQLNWVKNKDTNTLIKNVHIYKIEDIDIDDLLTNICKLQIVDSTKKIHSTEHKHYSYYYNEKSIKLVEQHYKEDIEYFNYKFLKKYNI